MLFLFYREEGGDILSLFRKGVLEFGFVVIIGGGRVCGRGWVWMRYLNYVIFVW